MFAFILRFLAALGLSAMASGATALDREIVLAPHAGADEVDRTIVRWQEAGRGTEAAGEVFERLARAYIAKARASLDAGFYTLAEKTIDVLEANSEPTAESRLLRGHVLHNLHRFEESEIIARRLVAERGEPRDLALLSDALLEQGHLVEAASVLERLSRLKPGVEAFSRIAHWRWLKGDLPGAMAATRRALDASDGHDAETRAWLLTRWSGLQLQAGDCAAALRSAEAAETALRDYAPARLARGRALIAQGKVAEAIEPLRQAERAVPLPEYQWWLADALVAAGHEAEARTVESRLKQRGEQTDPRTLALFLATRREETTKALRLARAELAERRDVFSRDALAWALLAEGRVAEAHAEMAAALEEGTKDARLFLHAGEIAQARGEAAAGKAFFAEAWVAAGSLTPSERKRLDRHGPSEAELAPR